MNIDCTIGADRIARLVWDRSPEPDELRETAERALAEVERVEVEVAAPDRVVRRALHLAGFRLEGTRRRAGRGADGSTVDVDLYGRLREDDTGGQSGFSAVMNSVLPRTRSIAHVLFHRDREGGREYLFCQTLFKPDWELPGGVVERFESPHTAATREVLEELGLEVELGDVLAVDWLPPYLGWDDAVELIFDGGVLSEEQLDSMVLQPSEIESVHWRRAADALDQLRPGAARRLQHIESEPNRTWYLEDGNPVG
ncbi:NUDIX domain-containing protein [Naumannella halotolerans]|uniref:NUDIX domain-containing protein n=1 Tax=Naumannella halotolerans TaxID=993414 RepID=A0A4R7J811_9ACTN|nr:NUDIX domain-containing protein [Naumannella halotolerans]TDT33611.1 NUDIX domain-containing protein [Naumannella halotolerans]